MLTVVGSGNDEPALAIPGERTRSAGVWFHLVSMGVVAAATIGVFFGIGFALLLHQPADARGRDRVAAVATPPALSELRQKAIPGARAGPGSPRIGAPRSDMVPLAFIPLPPGKSASPAIDAGPPTLPEHRAGRVAADVDAGPSDASVLVPPAVHQVAPPLAMPRPVEALAKAAEPVQTRRLRAEPAQTKPTPAEPAQTKPAQTKPGLAENPARSRAQLPAAEVAGLLARGDAFLRAGDVASARLFYERAADAGDGEAAMRAGATFDPAFLASVGLRQTLADGAKAQSWYARAHQPGAGGKTGRAAAIETK